MAVASVPFKKPSSKGHGRKTAGGAVGQAGPGESAVRRVRKADWWRRAADGFLGSCALALILRLAGGDCRPIARRPYKKGLT